jgi:hypothetical protein
MKKVKFMTRKDSEKDVDRPHYYSQFWLDIAAGRRVIGGPRPEDEAGETDLPEPTPLPTRKNGHNSAADSYKETRTVAATALVVDEDDEEEDDSVESSEEEIQQEDVVDEDEIPNIILDETSPKAQAPTHGELPIEGEDEATNEEEGEEEEEEDEEEWASRGGRKKAKTVRPVKPVKKPKPRRGF